MRFCDLDGETRLRLIRTIETTGAVVIHYCSDGSIQVALPRENVSGTIALIRTFGFNDLGGHYFPLGSDNPERNLRHDGPGTAAAPRGDHSYWLFWNFLPVEDL